MKKCFLIAGIVTAIILVSCQNPYAGLGKDLDLTGPQVSITSHKNMDYVGPTFTLTGSATDNVGVTEVSASIQSLGKTWIATLSQNTWSVNVEDLPNGEYLLEITAKDEAQNSSSSSITSLTLIVDSNSPNLLITLPELRELTNATGTGLSDLARDNFDNLPFFKNQSFQIRGALSEDFKAVSAEVGLYDINGALVYSRKITDKEKPENVTGSLYNFTITVETKDLDLPTSPLVKAQKNFYQVRTVAQDMAGNVEARALSYLCVYPDKDNPWAKVTSNAPEDQVGAGGSISGNVFDDDGIKKVYTSIVPRSTAVLDQDYLNWSVSLLTSTTCSLVIDKSVDKPQQYTWSLKVPTNAGAYRIYIRVEDMNGLVSPTYTTLDFLVPDVDVPTVDVDNTLINGMTVKDSPGAPFNIFGTWKDNSGGIKSVEVLWKEGSKTLPATVDGAAGTWTLSSLGFSLLPGAQNFEVAVTDLEGNVGRVRLYLIIDTDVTPPKVISVTSPTNNPATWNNFPQGSEITIKIEFSEPVIVSGIPTLDLNTAADSKATYLYGGSTQTLIFSYIVQAGDTSGDLDYASSTAIKLAGGFIRDSSGNNGDLTLAAPGAPGSLGAAENLVVDTTPPVLPVIEILNSTSFALSGFESGDFVEYSWDNKTQFQNWTLYSSPDAPRASHSPITVPMAGSTKILARARDRARNQLEVPADSYITNDTNLAYVLGVSSNNLNGTYKAGSLIDLRVNFSRNVVVTGNPSLKLETGTLDREALYLSGSGTPSLIFRYTVMTGDASSRLDYGDVNALVLNAGSIQDDRSSGAESAVLTLETPGLANSLGNNKSFVIDTQDPRILSLNSLSPDGYYKAGSVLPIIVNFSEPVIVKLSGGTPSLTLKMEGVNVPVPYSSGNGSASFIFNYTVVLGNNTLRLDGESLDLNGGVLEDPAGNPLDRLTLPLGITSGSLKSVKNFIIDTTAPVITKIDNPNLTGIQYFSNFSQGGIYLTLNEAVITPVNPSLLLSTGGDAFFTTSSFDAGNGTSSLLFTFSVASGQNSPDLTITQVRQKITDLAGNECTYTLPVGSNLVDNEDFVVDTTKPGVPTVSLSAGVINGANYANTDLSFTLGGSAADWASSEYSLDNGQNWTSYTGAFGITGEGSYYLAARQKDKAGNYSVASSALSFTMDKTPPLAPVILGLVNGTYSTDKSFTVAGESGATFQYTLAYVGGDESALWTGGTWQNYTGAVTLSTPDTYLVGARQKDAAGNVGPSGIEFSIVINKSSPIVTSVTSPSPDGAFNLNKVIAVEVTFSSPVYVSGAPTILLETGTTDRTASYSTGSGTNKLSFTYVVQTGDTSLDLNYQNTGALVLPSGSIKDVWGNDATLDLPALVGGSSLAGSKALVVDTTAPGAPGLSGITLGAKKIDQTFTLTGLEGGAIAQYSLDGGGNWTTYSASVTLADEITYNITSRQTDSAGNTSPQTGTVTLSIDKTNPEAPFISGITAGDKGSMQSFLVSGEPGATLEYSLNNGSTWSAYSGAVSLNPGAGNEITYDVRARQSDAAGNGPVSTVSPITLKVDLKAPVISTYSPLQNSVNVGKSESITLTFSEAVFRESGNITLKRLYNRFPVVMSVDQRNEYRSKLSGGNLTTFDTSYTLTTNGSTGGIPSSTGVYVLNYALEPTDVTLLAIFNSIGYNEIVIPVDSTQVSGSGTSTIVINPASDLPLGIHWYVLMDSTVFRDSVGNSFGGISANTTYQFASGPVATPVIRINKQSGAGTTQPTQTTYKISSETQGASLYYTSTNSIPTTYNPTLPGAPSDPTTASTAYSGAVTIGTNVTNAGYIYYAKAMASLGGFSNSAASEEIAFKTILSTNYDAGGSRYIWYRGSNNSGGPTTAPGFPIRWEDNQYAFVKCGAVDTAATPDRWYWITWEISVANVGSSPVPAEFKANWADQPADWDGIDNVPGNADDMGPSVYSWESGSNKLIFAGGYNNGTPASFEGWAAHTRP